MTYGVFHGINSAREQAVANDRVIQAVNSIQHDLLHMMAIRLCALCDQGLRPDDSSLIVLERELTQGVRKHLIEADRKWRGAVGLRATSKNDVATSIASFRRAMTVLRKQEPAIHRARHFRNKLLAHITLSYDPGNKVLLKELWDLTRLALRASRPVRLIFHQSDWNYLVEVRRAEASGRALAKAIIKPIRRRKKAAN